MFSWFASLRKRFFLFISWGFCCVYFFNLFSTINLHTFFSSQCNRNLQFYEWKCLMYVVELWRLKITLVLQYQIDKLQFLTTSRPGLIYIQSICWNHFTFYFVFGVSFSYQSIVFFSSTVYVYVFYSFNEHILLLILIKNTSYSNNHH